MKQNFKQLFYEALYEVGIPAISLETSAKILAVLYVHGNREEFVLNNNFVADIEYIQKKYRVRGGKTPNAVFTEELKKQIKNLMEYEEEHKDDVTGEVLFKDKIPSWAIELFKERYDINL